MRAGSASADAVGAHADGALAALSGRMAERVAAAGAELGDVCFTANAGRSRFAHGLAGCRPFGVRDGGVAGGGCARRDAVWARSAVPAAARARRRWRSCSRARARSMSGWAGIFMRDRRSSGRRLIGAPAFWMVCWTAGWSDLLFAGEAAELERTCNTQPALFAVEWALAELWRSWGIEPAGGVAQATAWASMWRPASPGRWRSRMRCG